MHLLKNKSISIYLTVAVFILSSVTIFAFGVFAGIVSTGIPISQIAPQMGMPRGSFDPYIQAWNILNENYIDQPIDPVVLIQGSIRGMMESLGDPYTGYIDPETFTQQNASLDGEYTGIGAWVDTSGESLIIISPMPGSPAEEAGLKPGDIVVAVDGELMEGIDPALVLENILGPAGTAITLTIARDGETAFLEFTLERAVIPIPSVESEMIEERVGYIQIYTFAMNSYQEFKDGVENLLQEGADSLIIDLRNNPGGLVDPVKDITSLFINNEVIFIEEWGDGRRVEYRTTKDILAKDVPIYLLVNQGTASASEIMAGALQDHHRAVLIGNQTFGKGLIQNWVPLDGENGAVRVTIAKWLTPNGRQIQELGLEPDFVIDYTLEDFEAGIDPQLEKALAFINNNN